MTDIMVVETTDEGDIIIDVVTDPFPLDVVDVYTDTMPEVIEVEVPGVQGPTGAANQGAVVMVGTTPPANPQVGWVWVRPVA